MMETTEWFPHSESVRLIASQAETMFGKARLGEEYDIIPFCRLAEATGEHCPEHDFLVEMWPVFDPKKSNPDSLLLILKIHRFRGRLLAAVGFPDKLSPEQEEEVVALQDLCRLIFQKLSRRWTIEIQLPLKTS